MRPPTIPEAPHIATGLPLVHREVRRGQETGDAEKQRLRIVAMGAERGEWQTLREQRERKLVVLVAERGGDLLKQRFVAAVIVDHRAEPRGFPLQPELRRARQHAANALFRETVERSLASA